MPDDSVNENSTPTVTDQAPRDQAPADPESSKQEAEQGAVLDTAPLEGAPDLGAPEDASPQSGDVLSENPATTINVSGANASSTPTAEEISTSTTTPEEAPTPDSPFAPYIKRARELLVLARAAIQTKKRKRLERIVKMLEKKQKIKTVDAELLLHVSKSAALEYLATLEKEGRIRQVGKTGAGVYYEKI